MKQKIVNFLAIFLLILSIAGQAMACENKSEVEQKYPYLEAAKRQVRENPSHYNGLNKKMVEQYKHDIDSTIKKGGQGTSDITPDMLVEKKHNNHTQGVADNQHKSSSSKSKRFGLVDNVYKIDIDIALENNETGRFKVENLPENASLILIQGDEARSIKNATGMQYVKLNSGKIIRFLVVQETKTGDLKPLYAHVLYPSYTSSTWQLNNGEVYAYSPAINGFIEKAGDLELYNETSFEKFKEVSSGDAQKKGGLNITQNSTNSTIITPNPPESFWDWVNGHIFWIVGMILFIALFLVVKGKNKKIVN